ncbi:MAG: LuxR C-terminal-related transcriptional regulator [Lachnospiraceae bacterium]|nr:LuxR C-terminal-related transcriptional regulator [Lachnospiraceae bacterium]
MKLFDKAILSTLLSIVQDGICFLSPDLEVLYHNPAMEYWYDTSGRPDMGKCYKIYHGRKEPCEECPALRAMRTGKNEEGEVLFMRKSRRRGWQKIYYAPVYGDDGRLEMIIEYVHNLTNERKAILSAELVDAQNRTLMRLIEQKDEERHRKEKQLLGNMNQSFTAILNHLKTSLDDKSYELIKNQLELLKGSMGGAAPEQLLYGQELEIARYITEGLMSKEIAGRMGLSKKTVDYHRSNIRKKLSLEQKDNLRQAVTDYLNKNGISALN